MIGNDYCNNVCSKLLQEEPSCVNARGHPVENHKNHFIIIKPGRICVVYSQSVTALATFILTAGGKPDKDSDARDDRSATVQGAENPFHGGVGTQVVTGKWEGREERLRFCAAQGEFQKKPNGTPN